MISILDRRETVELADALKFFRLHKPMLSNKSDYNEAAWILFAALFFSLNPMAQATDIPGCRDIHTSQQVDECEAARYKLSDNELNTAYRALLIRIEESYEPAPELGAELKHLVRTSQRAWINFRDANCAVEAFEIEKGTSAYTTTVNACRARMTRARTLELRSLP
jgi:uncharacterized protein YecT (DUF1311 family)